MRESFWGLYPPVEVSRSPVHTQTSESSLLAQWPLPHSSHSTMAVHQKSWKPKSGLRRTSVHVGRMKGAAAFLSVTFSELRMAESADTDCSTYMSTWWQLSTDCITSSRIFSGFAPLASHLKMAYICLAISPFTLDVSFFFFSYQDSKWNPTDFR